MPFARPGRAFVYVLVCCDGSLYTGWTVDLARRVRAHARGRASRYTRSRLPVLLAAWLRFTSGSEARSFEVRFKTLGRARKLAALRAREAFGFTVHKPPLIETHPGVSRKGAHSEGERMTSLTAPVGKELRELIEKAKVSQARIATGRGDIVFSFYPDDAPQHCAAFIKLAGAGFYDGVKFHRVEPGFVVQGGDPSGTGTGGPGYKLRAEFNERPHLRGTVAMARANSPDSAGSQFYICLDDARFLDKQYTVFGQMREGFEALDAIRVGDVMTRVAIEPKG